MHKGVTGHRGNCELFPENTLESFASAIELGVDWIELDLRKSADGRLVVIHDADSGRVAGDALEIASTKFSELAKLDVACLFREEHGLSLEERPPCRIPLFEEVLELLLSKPGTRLSAQPKDACVEEALALCARTGALGRVGFNDGDLAKLEAVKRFDRRIPVFYDLFDQPFDAALAAALENGFESLVVHRERLDAAKVARIKAAGLEPGAWTVDDENLMRLLLSIGVERFYTDRPSALIKLKSGKGLK